MIKGKVISMGDIEIDGEKITGVFVECDKIQLEGSENYLYRDVEIRLE